MNYLILTFIMKKTFVLFFLFFVLNNVYSNKITLYNSLNNKIGIIIYNTFGDFTIENILPNNSIILESKNILYIETYSRFKIKYFFKTMVDSFIIKDTTIVYQSKKTRIFKLFDPSNMYNTELDLMLNVELGLEFNEMDFFIFKILETKNEKKLINLIEDRCNKKYNSIVLYNKTNINKEVTNFYKQLIYRDYYRSLFLQIPSIIKNLNNNYIDSNYYIQYCDSKINDLISKKNDYITDPYILASIFNIYYFAIKKALPNFNYLNKIKDSQILAFCKFLICKTLINKNPNINYPIIDNFIQNSIIDTEYINYIVNLIEREKYFNSNNLLQTMNKDTIQLSKLLKNSSRLILLDFWASFCGPCKAEMPPSKKIIKKYQNKLDYIYISIDNDVKQWYNAVKTEKLQDYPNNYIFYNFEKSEIFKKFKIESIPRYMLFGKDGKLISADAPRPSDPKFIEMIEKNL